MHQDDFETDPFKTNPLAKYLYLVLILLCAIAIGTFASYYYNAQHVTQLAKQLVEGQSTITNKFNQIVQHEELMDDTVRKIEQINRNSSLNWSKEARIVFEEAVSSNNAVSDVYIGLPSGQIIDGRGWEASSDYNCTERNWYKNAIAKPGEHLTDLYYDDVNQSMYLTEAKAVLTKGTVIGVIGVDSEIKEFNDILKSGMPANCIRVLVDKENDVVKSDDGVFMVGAPLEVAEADSVSAADILNQSSLFSKISLVKESPKWLKAISPVREGTYSLILLYPLNTSPLATTILSFVKVLILLLVTVLVGCAIKAYRMKAKERQSVERDSAINISDTAEEEGESKKWKYAVAVTLFILVIIGGRVFITERNSEMRFNAFKEISSNALMETDQNYRSKLDDCSKVLKNAVYGEEPSLCSLLEKQEPTAIREKLNEVIGKQRSVMYAYVGMEDGTIIIVPEEPLPEGYDPRSRPWYKSAAEAEDVVYGNLYSDSTSNSLVTSLSLRIKDDEMSGSEVMGVMGIDMSVEPIFENPEGMSISVISDNYIIARSANEWHGMPLEESELSLEKRDLILNLPEDAVEPATFRIGNGKDEDYITLIRSVRGVVFMVSSGN